MKSSHFKSGVCLSTSKCRYLAVVILFLYCLLPARSAYSFSSTLFKHWIESGVCHERKCGQYSLCVVWWGSGFNWLIKHCFSKIDKKKKVLGAICSFVLFDFLKTDFLCFCCCCFLLFSLLLLLVLFSSLFVCLLCFLALQGLRTPFGWVWCRQDWMHTCWQRHSSWKG